MIFNMMGWARDGMGWNGFGAQNHFPPAGPLPQALFFLVKNNFPPAGPLPQAPFSLMKNANFGQKCNF